jgi:curved DNA-binding protein CbpA
MTIRHLKGAKNLQELKKLYLTLAKKYHPDITGGNTEIMKVINNEYDYLKEVLPNKDDQKESSHSMNAYRDIIDKLLKHPYITVEIVGSWLWVSGSGTYNIKDDILKPLQFRFSGTQKKWYWFSGIEKSKKRRGGNLKKAIQKYGITRLESDPIPQLT